MLSKPVSRQFTVVMVFIVAVLPTRKKESQSYFNCGRRAVQFHLVFVVSLLNALNQIDAKKHKNASRKTYSFLEVKLRQSSKKSWTKIKLI